mmetsp:Transcript_17052/g.12210  ORF Transcript_17052/g.12210 Transcript_17052/m.12210 type:complete len:84 (+) Transcript_17052:251-502(+)
MHQLNTKSKQVEARLEDARKRKQAMVNETDEILAEIKGVKTELKRVEEQLEEALASRKFVEEVLQVGQPIEKDIVDEKVFLTQ